MKSGSVTKILLEAIFYQAISKSLTEAQPSPTLQQPPW